MTNNLHRSLSVVALWALCVACSNDSDDCDCGSVGGGTSCRDASGGVAGGAGWRAASGGLASSSAGTTNGGSTHVGVTASGASSGTHSVVPNGGTGGVVSSTIIVGGALATGGSAPTNGGSSLLGGTSSVGGMVATGGFAVAGASTNVLSGGNAATLGGSGGTGTAAVAGAPALELTVSTLADVHPISPLIYGVNGSQALCANAGALFTLCRLGGNRWSTYNWETNASNAGDQGCFQNDSALGASDLAGSVIKDLLQAAGQHGATSVITIPIIDYVAADKLGGTPSPDCSGDVRRTQDYLNTRFEQNVARKAAAFVYPPDTSDGRVYQDEFLSYVQSQAADAKVVVTLDNQPELWSQTHSPVHNQHATYEEVVRRNVEYAKMVRQVWPEAEVTGYGGYGYYAFLNLQDAPDSSYALFLDYYLAEMRVAGIIEGRHLIDYLDVHWYSEVTVDNVRITSETTTGSMARAEARMQAPRSLWDPEFVESSWLSMYGAVQLIPWLRGKVEAFYPDTKLAISSWSYGGEQSISGAIAAADALGVFGREGLGLAAIELPSSNYEFALGAFAAYRNFDGTGAAFGDTSVRAESSDVAKVSVYASTDSLDPSRIVIVAINRSEVEQRVTLRLEASASHTQAARYELTSAAATPVAGTPLFASSSNRFDTSLPGYSITVLVPLP